VALACVGCSTGPADPDPDLTSDWAATVTVGSNQWRFDMSLTQTGDSLTGSARVAATPSGFSEGYTVRGRVAGDSVRFALQPVEDATINVRGVKQRGDVVGVMWFNVDSLNTRPVTFTRYPQKL
jgi:hypothetical protein